MQLSAGYSNFFKFYNKGQVSYSWIVANRLMVIQNEGFTAAASRCRENFKLFHAVV